MNKKSWGIVALIIFLYLFSSIVSCSKARKDVEIGALLALTGSGANYGKSLKQGIDLAVEEINQAGGISGKNLKVIYEDSQTDAKAGVNGFIKLAEVNKVPLVIGSISSVVLAVAPIADEKKIVLLNSSAMSPKICDAADDFLFSLMINGSEEAKLIAKKLVEDYGDEPVAVLYSNNSSGIDTKDNFVNQLTSIGGKLAIAEGYELNITDFRTPLTKIQNSVAKIGFLIAFSSQEFAKILIQTKELGINIQWYSYSGIETKETLQLVKNAAEGIIYSYPQYDAGDKAFQKFQKEYMKRYGEWADIYTVTSYDAVKLVAQVMSRYGTSPEQIQKGLRESVGFEGIFGKVQFGKKQCVEKPLMWKTIVNNSFQLLEK